MARSVLTGILISLLNCYSVFSQDSTLVISTGKNDTTIQSSDESPHALYAGMGYGSNMIYLGSTISQNSPFAYSSIAYGYNNEFFVSVSAMHLAGFKPFFPLNMGAINYSHTFNSWFDIAAGLYGYNVSSSLRDTLFGNFLYTDLTLGVDWRLLYSKISVGGLKMDQSQFYLQFRNSRYFQTPDILKGKATISFDPYINLIWGTMFTSETVTGTDTVVSTFPPFGRGRPGNQSTSETVITRDFGIMEVDFGLPVSVNFDIMSLEIEAGYVLPLSKDPYYQSSKGFLLLVSVFLNIL